MRRSEVPLRDVLDADVIHQLILPLIIIKALRDTCRFQRELNGAAKSKLQRIQKYLKLQKFDCVEQNCFATIIK